jgi:hypothetical protein
MHFRNGLRFKGYWLSLLSWIVLTFAAPVASAVAETSEGWMRLCSAHGVQWVYLAADEAPAEVSQCACLSLAISLAHPVQSSPEYALFSEVLASYRSLEQRFPHTAVQPRSPPISNV